ncbi:winged helix-turn-helix domain-containing protein [Leptolyngbya sp. AN03gr2]|uniref:winged helix-turn-helix domain-containing protein n=1 Tax=unclassified Leptolyngbya TaxID=2650499 RepID=UPI003D31A552
MGQLRGCPNLNFYCYSLFAISLIASISEAGLPFLFRSFKLDPALSIDESPTEEAVKTHIRTLRQKLRNVGASDDLIETVHGLGYRMKQLDESPRNPSDLPPVF